MFQCKRQSVQMITWPPRLESEERAPPGKHPLRGFFKTMGIPSFRYLGTTILHPLFRFPFLLLLIGP
jgi:hypothetical protein